MHDCLGSPDEAHAATPRDAFPGCPPARRAPQVLRHPATLSYLALSGLAGLALTYYYNAEGNRKVNTMLRVALQLVGLASLFLR